MLLARVARLSSRADTATTYKVYLHFFPDDFVADTDRLDAYITPKPTAHSVSESLLKRTTARG